jgi:glucan endo-1,3-beta-D-glucosidase
MRFSKTILAAANLAASVSAADNYLGFNSGSTLPDHSAKFKADWLAEFNTAQALAGAPGKFNAVRLYTNIQAYSTDDPIQAFEAAIETKTFILLGVWTSGTTSIANELSALKKAVDKYGQDFVDLVIGISIGSEDLYRNSVTGVTNNAGQGNQPSAIVGFINDYRKAFANTALASKPVGHVDTWDVWQNTTNNPVLDAVDWVGVDEYPYYENGKGNDIKNAPALFDAAYNAAINAAKGKPVWLTETGWPTTGPTWDQAVPSVENAQYYWDNIGCRKLFGKTPTFWYTLRDSNPDNKAKFAITSNLSTSPSFNLTCPTTFDVPTTSTTTFGTSQPTGTSTTGSGGTGTGSSSSPSATKNAAVSGPHMSGTACYAALAVAAGLFSLL